MFVILSRILIDPIRANRFYSSILHIYIKSKLFTFVSNPSCGAFAGTGKCPDDTEYLHNLIQFTFYHHELPLLFFASS